MDIDPQVFQSNPDVYNRKMKSNQSTRVKRYRKNLLKKLGVTKIPRQIHKLQKINTEEWTHAHTKKLERLDAVITQAMLDAERKCLPAHLAPWSSIIQDKYEEVKYIKKNQENSKTPQDTVGNIVPS